MPDNLGISAIVAAGLGAVGALVGTVAQRRTRQADYADRLVDATIPAVEMLAKRLASVENEVADCERRYDALDERCHRIVAHLRAQGVDLPVEDG